MNDPRLAPHLPWYRSLRFRLVATAIVVEVCMLGLLLSNSYRLVGEALETQAQSRLAALAPLLNAALGGRVFQRDYSEIDAVLRQLVRTQASEFSYLVVRSPTGETLGQAGRVPPVLGTDQDIRGALADLSYDTQIDLVLSGDTKVGTVHFGLSLAELAALRSNVLTQSLLIAGFEVLISLLLLGFFGYLLTRHLGVLLDATRRVTDGDFTVRLALDQRDEVGTLAEHFNFMVNTLARDLEQRNRDQQVLEFQAHHDALTHLPNRMLFTDRLAQALARAQRSQRLLAIAYLDLDDFKPVNDRYGHKTGDQLLVMVAQRLKEHVRAEDTVSRIGGDEFVLLLSDLSTIDECMQTIDRLQAALGEPFPLEPQTLGIAASIGLTIYPFDEVDPDTLLRHADQAMYHAKQGGRNRVHLFDAEQDRLEAARRGNRARYEAALTRQEFVLFYQPQVDMRSGRVVGAEALIRWQHPEAGLLSPSCFLPEIEDSDLVIPLGEWVLEAALTQLGRWHAAGLALKLSVNISARHLQSPHFLTRLTALLERHPDAPPALLQLEVVESAALEDMAHIAQVIDYCHALGVSFALDDFGTGYSSLAYFKQLRVDTLKIDQSFVRDMMSDDEDRAIVEGVISLTRTFRRQVVAEGVENAETGVALLELGCAVAQGYGIARPMPAEQLPGWIAGWQPYPQWKS